MAENMEEGPERSSSLPDDSLLPEDGVKELSDRFLEYMTEIELADIPEAMEQVLDDFLMQCGGIPEEMEGPEVFDQIVNHQLAVTLAFQLGRLSGRAPQLVERFIQEALDKWGSIHLENETEVTAEDFSRMTERVLPKLRRWRSYLDREYGDDDTDDEGG
jgi:hypothetical protein